MNAIVAERLRFEQGPSPTIAAAHEELTMVKAVRAANPKLDGRRNQAESGPCGRAPDALKAKPRAHALEAIEQDAAARKRTALDRRGGRQSLAALARRPVRLDAVRVDSLDRSFDTELPTDLGAVPRESRFRVRRDVPAFSASEVRVEDEPGTVDAS